MSAKLLYFRQKCPVFWHYWLASGKTSGYSSSLQRFPPASPVRPAASRGFDLHWCKVFNVFQSSSTSYSLI